MRFLSVIIAIIIGLSSCSQVYDVVVAGGGASGVAAGLQAARMGAKTLIVEETPWLGGMLTSAGVSAIDGNYALPSGIWGEFKDALAEHYGGLDNINTGWVSNVLFEPSVGNELFKKMVEAEKHLSVFSGASVQEVSKCSRGWKLKLAYAEKEIVLVARRLIDATELGDVAVMCGVEYDLGMESRELTGESIAPESSNGIVQDLTYVAVLKDFGRDVSIAEPEGYDKWEFAGCCDNPLCINPKEPDRIWPAPMMISYGKLPGEKYMINWPIEGNDYYVNLVEMTPSQRDSALAQAKLHTMRFIYFIQNELGYRNLGLADDEFPTEDKLPFIPYHRESRRIHGLVRFKQQHVVNPFEYGLYRTGIAVGDYPVDHHHARYTGEEELPDLHFSPIPSFNVPMGVLIPEGVEDLIVAEKSISVSNIMNGATRLQPVVLQLGQAAGALAALSLNRGCAVAEVNLRELQEILLASGVYLMPYLDVTKEDARFKAYQRVGASGALRGEGRNVGWSNQTWLRAEDPLLSSELEGLFELYPQLDATEFEFGSGELTTGDLLSILGKLKDIDLSELNKALECYDFQILDEDIKLNRGEAALIIDALLDPFHSVMINIYGEVANN